MGEVAFCSMEWTRLKTSDVPPLNHRPREHAGESPRRRSQHASDTLPRKSVDRLAGFERCACAVEMAAGFGGGKQVLDGVGLGELLALQCLFGLPPVKVEIMIDWDIVDKQVRETLMICGKS